MRENVRLGSARFGIGLTLVVAGCSPDGQRADEALDARSAPAWGPGWEPLPPSPGIVTLESKGVTSDPVATSGIRVWSQSHLNFAYGPVRRLAWIRRSASGWDSSWTVINPSLPVGVQLSATTPGLAAVRRSDGNTNLALTADNGRIYQTWYDGATLYNFTDTGGQSASMPAISASGTKVHLWARGLNNHLWLRRWNGSSWDAWLDLGSLPGGATLAEAPSATLKPTTSTIVVAARSSGAVYTAEWNDATSALGAWTNRGAPSGGLSGAPLVVGAVVSAAGSMRLYQRNNASPSLLYELAPPLYSSWSVTPSQSSGATTLSDAEGSPSGIYLGSTPSTGTQLVVSGNNQQANWRKWYDTTPSASLKMATPRTLRVIHQRGGETFGPAGCETVEKQFEGTATVVPPGQLGCTNGALLMQPGTGLQRSAGTGSTYAYAMGVGAAPLNCLDGTVAGTSTCTVGAMTIPRCEAPGGDMIAPGTGMLTFYNGNWGADNILDVWGRSPVTPRLSSVTQKGTSRVYPGGQGNGIARGASYFLESTDCGATWTYNSMADACDPAFLSPVVCPTGGTDRPQTGAWTSASGFAYAVIPVPNTIEGEKLPIFRRNLNVSGSTWSRISNPIAPATGLSIDKPTQPCHTPSRPVAMGNRVFWACVTPSTNSMNTTPNINLVYFDELSSSVSSAILVRQNDFEEWQFANGASAWPIVSPVAQVGNDSYLRLVWPKRTTFSPGQHRQELRMSIVRVSGSTVQQLSYTSISAISSGGSVIYPSFIIPVETQTQGPSSGLAMLTWYDTDTSDQSVKAQGTAWGNVRYRGCVLRDLDPTCTPLTLSVHNGVATSWPFTGYKISNGFPGDYQESAGYFDVASNKYRFLVHYTQATADRDLIRANIVEVDP